MVLVKESKSLELRPSRASCQASTTGVTNGPDEGRRRARGKGETGGCEASLDGRPDTVLSVSRRWSRGLS